MSRRGPYNIITDPKTIFGRRLYMLLNEHGMTRQEMADELNIHAKCIGDFLNKYTFPSTQTIIKICNTYNVSADWLLGLSDERELRGGQHEFND